MVVTPASVQDWDGGREAMLRAKLAAPGLRRGYADSACVACRFRACWFARGIVCLARRPAGPGLTIQEKRWVAERTFGWLGR